MILKTKKGNKLIAEFMNMKFIPKTKWYNILGYSVDVYKYDGLPAIDVNMLKFHYSWNWLMPIVKKN